MTIAILSNLKYKIYVYLWIAVPGDKKKKGIPD